MPTEFAAFAFIITLAGVVNGLGIVRWVAGFADFLRHQRTIRVTHYWVYGLAAGFQFLLHVVLWWSLWGVRSGGEINFLTYLYLLTGPILLYLGSVFLARDLGDEEIDLRKHFYSVRATYSTILIMVWLWGIFTPLVIRGHFSPATPWFAGFLAVAVLQRATANPKAQAAVALINWVLLGLYVGIIAMELGGTPA